MLITERLAQDGAYLFRWRSFLPLLLAPLFFFAGPESVLAERSLGEAFAPFLSALAFMLAAAGLLVRAMTVGYVPAGTSGRNTRTQVAERLNTTGAYAVCRNPLYLGNALGFLGFALFTKVWWLVVIGGLAYWLYIQRIIAAEERFLLRKYGAQYREWTEKTPVFVPRTVLWRRPELPFSLRTVLRREYNGLVLLAVAFLAWSYRIDVMLEGMSVSDWLEVDIALIGFACAAIPLALLLRSLKKHTAYLNVAGR